jgi:hypothetical protein
MERVSVGMDVSKASVVIAVDPSGERWTSETPPAAIDALVARLRALTPTIVVVEATGGYERALVAASAAAGLSIAVVNPRQVRAFAQALGRTAKTDAIDAAVLAAFGARVQPEARAITDADTQALAALVVRRRQLLEMIGMEQRRLERPRRAASRAICATTFGGSPGGSTLSMGRSARRSRRAPSGASMRICCAASRAWGRPPRARSSRSCQSSGGSTVAPLRRSSAWRPSIATVARIAASATSGVGAGRSARRCTWPRWRPRDTTPCCERFIAA